MVQITLIASLVATLAFSSAALKIMGDAEKALPVPMKTAAKTCDVSRLSLTSFGNAKDVIQ